MKCSSQLQDTLRLIVFPVKSLYSGSTKGKEEQSGFIFAFRPIWLHFAFDSKLFCFEFSSRWWSEATSFTKPCPKHKGVLNQYLPVLSAEHSFLTYQQFKKTGVKKRAQRAHTHTEAVIFVIKSLNVGLMRTLHSCLINPCPWHF